MSDKTRKYQKVVSATESDKRPRRYLTAREKEAILDSQGWVCAHCGGPGPFEWDHSTVHVWRPEKKPDTGLCVACHLKKSKLDVAKIAKVKRLLRKADGTWRPKKKKISTRSFPSGKKKWPTKKLG